MSQFHNLDAVPFHTISNGQLKLIAGTALMVFWADVRGGTETPRHAHPNEQITWLVEGRMDYQIGNEPIESCSPGTVVLVPANAPHHVWYHEDCKIVEFFNPPRIDLFPEAARNPYGIAEPRVKL